MFLDASALVALLEDNHASAGYIAALDGSKSNPWTSPIARAQAVTMVAARLPPSDSPESRTERAGGLVGDLLEALGAKEMHITSGIGTLAQSLLARYGAESGHSARLSITDAFALACARSYRVPLLHARGSEISALK